MCVYVCVCVREREREREREQKTWPNGEAGAPYSSVASAPKEPNNSTCRESLPFGPATCAHVFGSSGYAPDEE